MFLNDTTLLDAISFAMNDYEQCFHGVGFPHALLSSLLAGPKGADVVAAVVAAGLVPAWLAARTVGSKLVNRASKEDAHASMASQPESVQGRLQIIRIYLPSPREYPNNVICTIKELDL